MARVNDARGGGVESRTNRAWMLKLLARWRGSGTRSGRVGLGSLTLGKGGGSGIDSGRPLVCSTSSRRRKEKRRKRNKIVFLFIIFICIDFRVC